MQDMIAARDRAIATAHAREATAQVPARACYFCDQPTKARARVGIPATESYTWTAVCIEDRDRAFRSVLAVDRLRDDR